MTTKKSKAAAPEDKVALYEALVATAPEVKRKGATMPYTSVNGHMFSFLSKEGSLALRLPDEARAAFLKRYKTTLHEAYGHILPEYVTVPERLLKKTSELKPFFQLSYAYAKALKPKATTKSKG